MCFTNVAVKWTQTALLIISALIQPKYISVHIDEHIYLSIVKPFTTLKVVSNKTKAYKNQY